MMLGRLGSVGKAFGGIASRQGNRVASNTLLGLVAGSPLQSPLISNDFPLTQQRWRWTKAKKKRQARYERNRSMEERGKSHPKPANYIPLDTKVVNAHSKEYRLQEIKDSDEKASVELREKLKAVATTQQNQTLRHHMTGVTMSDRVRKLFELRNGNQREVIQAQKQLGMQIFQLREGDTGSSAVQVIALTTRIQQLQTHMAKHRKDKHSKRGMDALYVRRRKLLDYMERKDFDSYRKVVKTLGLIR